MGGSEIWKEVWEKVWGLSEKRCWGKYGSVGGV